MTPVFTSESITQYITKDGGSMTEVVSVSGARTAEGNYGRTLRGIPVVKPGGIVIREALERD